MRESFGSVFTYNIIIVFLLIVFAFLLGTVSYFKAFKVNNHIANAIEKFEGYNSLAVREIDNALITVGYRMEADFECPVREGTLLEAPTGVRHRYCIYLQEETNNYRTYGILTFMNMDLPVIGQVMRLPIYSKTIRLYNF